MAIVRSSECPSDGGELLAVKLEESPKILGHQGSLVCVCVCVSPDMCAHKNKSSSNILPLTPVNNLIICVAQILQPSPHSHATVSGGGPLTELKLRIMENVVKTGAFMLYCSLQMCYCNYTVLEAHKVIYIRQESGLQVTASDHPL